MVTAPAPSWETYALACTGQGSPCKNGDLCLPAENPIPEGFELCVLHAGVEPCPAAYPRQHIFYDGFDDGRACSSCECGPPTGSECLAYVSVYIDDACQDCFWCANVGLTSLTSCIVEPDPFPTPFSFSLGSMSAKLLTYTPGACAAKGGEPIGAAVAKGPSTFCCQD